MLLLSACSTATTKVQSQIDYAKFSKQEAPLATELGEQEEYEFALDLARFQVEHQRYAQAEPLLQKLRRERSNDLRVYRLLAKVYEGQKKLDRALVAWREANKISGHSLSDESELARLALIMEHYQEAERIYQSWLARSDVTTQVSALNNLGFSALLQKDFMGAKRFFEQALQQDPLNSKASNNLKLLQNLEV
ncbi:tetratricopeptide repeat protein [Thiomicrorhabdus sp. zzn3]|uniref:tetratricopeptide repeat protein n=1 Tax=Thiomicrorhabdus sp. zzn3 TaxID=3039775 RepID=UPI002436EA7B|nr:tetratricopeptide repeat protein [Thiomicrorhabdus sp. zzn3]MDG6779041.1 tetratricopeptide repeat protein [Thiomicrorhabdus sp. zzn3]